MTDEARASSGASVLLLPVRGMTCVSCASRLQTVLGKTDGVADASVSFAAETARIRFDQTRIVASGLVSAILDAGFEVPNEVVRLAVPGMTADGAQRVERALRAHPGVFSAQVSLAKQRAIVSLPSGTVSEADLIGAVRAAGHEATHAASSEEEIRAEQHEESGRLLRERVRLWASLALTLPLVIPMLLSPVGVAWSAPGWLQLVLATPVQFGTGARFYRGAWSALRAKSANMDVLVAIGSTAAYGLSVALLGAGHQHLYFEASAAVITLVALGKWLETGAKRRTLGALQALTALKPDTARILRHGHELEVAAEAVGPGETVFIRPGERVPVDGQVVSGESEVDQSLITGESLPVAVGAGDFVSTGAINGNGALEVTATRVGDDSMLSRIIAQVRDAQSSRVPIQRLVDRVAALFVPAVVAIAGVTFLGWIRAGTSLPVATMNAVAVLVIACPCALGLATPAALMVGTGAAASRGILLRDAQALETTRGVRTVVFDKTGTLTVGRPQIQQVESIGSDEATLLRWAASALLPSEHPVARAVVGAAAARGLRTERPTAFRALPGRGITARVEGEELLVGNRRLMQEHGIDLGAWTERAEAWQADGLTLTWVARQGVLAGYLGTGDPIRPGASAALGRLRQRGIEVVLLSGDSRQAATRVARELGIGRVLAEVLPGDKAREIERLRETGRVAMVGDGVNDAPALAAADLGFAMSSGTDVAMHTAGITLMRPDPGLVVDALDLARATTRTIRQNLFWAFAYNVIGIPLAALGWLSPALAGGAMALSSLTVVSNALRLRRWRPEQ